MAKGGWFWLRVSEARWGWRFLWFCCNYYDYERFVLLRVNSLAFARFIWRMRSIVAASIERGKIPPSQADKKFKSLARDSSWRKGGVGHFCWRMAAVPKT
jgi:hypothetical protein